MLGHAEELAQARAQARAQNTPVPVDVPSFVRRWGGVRVIYRRGLVDSPAYRLNHEEVRHALDEGIVFVEHVTPVRGSHRSRRPADCPLTATAKTAAPLTFEARSVVMAAGTAPNIVYEREHPGTFQLDAQQRFFQSHVLASNPNGQVFLRPAQSSEIGFFTSYQNSKGSARRPQRLISYFGDNHPHYAGSVVKAMASAKEGHLAIAEALSLAEPLPQKERQAAWPALKARLEGSWLAHIARLERLGPNILEVVVHAPAQAAHFRPGQFYRLQTYEAHAPKPRGVSP